MPTMVKPGASGYENTWLWNIGFSAYWFATSYKWFILLFIVIPAQVAALVPGGEKNSAWGIVYGVGAIWGVIGPAIFGGWSDRFDSKWGHRQPFIAVGALVTVVALFFMMGANSIPLLVIGYFLLQLGEDIGQGPYAAMMPELVPPENAGKASSVMNLLQSGARLASGVAFLILLSKLGANVFTAVYAGVAIVQLLGAGATLYTVRNVRRTVPVSQLPQEPFWKRWLAPWASRDFRWVWFTRFLSTLAFAMVSNYFLYYLTDMFPNYLLFGYDLKDPKAAAIMVVLAMSLLGVFGSLIAAPLADSWGRKPLIYLSGLTIFAVLIPFALVRDLTSVFLLTIPFGIAFGIYVSADWALATDVLPDKGEAGTQMGVWSMSVTSVQIVAGAAGPFIDWGNNIKMGVGYTGLIWTSGAIFALSTVLIKQVKGSK